MIRIKIAGLPPIKFQPIKNLHKWRQDGRPITLTKEAKKTIEEVAKIVKQIDHKVVIYGESPVDPKKHPNATEVAQARAEAVAKSIGTDNLISKNRCGPKPGGGTYGFAVTFEVV